MYNLMQTLERVVSLVEFEITYANPRLLLGFTQAFKFSQTLSRV